MSGKKPGKKKARKKKSASRKMATKKKPAQPSRPPHSNRSRKRTSAAQIHQGVGPVSLSQSETREIADDAAEYGGES
jgi:hypothetical protein